MLDTPKAAALLVALALAAIVALGKVFATVNVRVG